MKLSDRIEQMVNPVHGLPQELDNLLENWFGHKSRTANSVEPNQRKFCPRTNVVEREKDFVISIELPGVPVGDVRVEASDDKLLISGEKKFESNENDGETDKLHRRERATGKFERAFEFPTQVDFDKINAEFKLGVLSVTVPKSEKVLPRKIEINVTE